jgi:hypothetical protein
VEPVVRRLRRQYGGKRFLPESEARGLRRESEKKSSLSRDGSEGEWKFASEGERLGEFV